MSLLVRSGALSALALAAFLAAGCGGTELDDAKMEAALEQNLEKSVGQKVATVDCPSGVAVEPGKTFDCNVELTNGERETATVKIVNDDADTEVTNLRPNK